MLTEITALEREYISAQDSPSRGYLRRLTQDRALPIILQDNCTKVMRRETLWLRHYNLLLPHPW